MLSWQLASLMMAHSLKMAVTSGGSIVCCGELVASSPKKLSNQFLKPPCSFASRSVLLRNSARPFLVLPRLNGGSRTLYTPTFDRRQIVDGNATFGVRQQKAHCLHFLILYGDWSTGQLILACSRPNRPMETVSRDPASRPPRSNPLYGGASVYYRGFGNEQHQLGMHHLATASDG
ncbi:hypothetical protein N7447_001851 [Penicillium robsamsonii]|uniref:uncharacterized protein n=1 Tax=Penicillium robsamsonii TaxID=1792511 RepID=UPI002546E390|nr:uncharacterized protein N7447_001851 [Penicillium robsamsonii]KAJ5835825.1 hypothetical protein N7447_001851 [Penicillium robsamsonii]